MRSALAFAVLLLLTFILLGWWKPRVVVKHTNGTPIDTIEVAFPQ